MKLISMVDYILLLAKNFREWKDANSITLDRVFKDLQRIEVYAKFLKRTLTLGDFVPCDLEGNVLKKPIKENYTQKELENSDLGYDFDDYQQAEERVLFKFEAGFDSEDVVLALNESSFEGQLSDYTIEDLVIFWVECDIILTPNAIKQLQ